MRWLLSAADGMNPHTKEQINKREPKDIHRMRLILRHWPLPRGKGALMRIFLSRLHGRDFLIEVEPGILIPGALDDYMVYWVFVHGYATDNAVRLSRLLIRPGDTLLDIGANIGLWAMGAAMLAGSGGHVYAFEPVAENMSRLTDNLRLNGLENVTCEALALSDSQGTVTIFKPSYGNSGHPSLGRREGVHIAVETRTTTLDNYCYEHAIRHVDFVKVDVEGAELLVFRGGAHLLSSHDAPAILFEVNEETAANLGSSSSLVKSMLAGHGYRIFHYDGWRLNAVEPDRSEAPGDLFAFKSHHFGRYRLLNELLTV